MVSRIYIMKTEKHTLYDLGTLLRSLSTKILVYEPWLGLRSSVPQVLGQLSRAMIIVAKAPGDSNAWTVLDSHN